MAKSKKVKVKVKGVCCKEAFCAKSKYVLTHRVTATVDLGEVSVEEGFKLCLSLSPALIARGLVASPLSFTTGQVSLTVVNVGREIVEIKQGDQVATYWVEPIIPMEVEELT